MKVALITDTHFGARGDSLPFADYFERFYKEIFFPTLKKRNINTIIHLGDLMDRRKYINFHSLQRCFDYFFNQAKIHGIRIIGLVGNHDAYFKNTNDINALSLLLGKYDVDVYSRTTEITLDGAKILLVPWITTDNQEDAFELIKSTKAEICLGHLELMGFEMYRGTVNVSGLDKSVFNKFDIVCSGHFHHKSNVSNIHYLGAPYEMTWSDFNDTRGFHILDTKTRELEYVINPLKMFHKIYYDEKGKTAEEIINLDYSNVRNTVVKVIVKTKDNPYWYDLFIENLEKVGLVELVTSDDHLNLSDIKDDDITGEMEDTLTLLKKYIETMDFNNKEELQVLLKNLYEEALRNDDQI
jgi:DNA repair exonuclease SbcCD nuclease subunit